MKQGVLRYFTGTPCLRGHVCERRTLDRGCVICTKNRVKAFKRTNPEKAKAWKLSWVKRNPDKVNAMARKQLSDPAKMARHHLHVASWAKRNRPLKASAEGRRRSRQLSGTPAWSDRSAIGIIYRAAEVIRLTGFDVQVDHVFPLQGKMVSGLHVHNNLQIISSLNNQSKSNRFEGELL